MIEPTQTNLMLLLGLAAGGAVLAVLAFGRMKMRIAKAPSPKQLARDENGTATVEFALIFPVFMFFAMMLTQTMLVMTGAIYVDYAAFAATRAAIVQIPQDYTFDGEIRNEYVEGGVKHELIRSAAAMALVPVSGTVSGGRGPDLEYVEAVENLYAQFGRQPPNWVERLLSDRVNYAFDYTDIEVHETSVRSGGFVDFEPQYRHQFGPRDPITVTVHHELHLAVPYAGLIFADGENDAGLYTMVSAGYTLTNEGISPDLPLEPGLPRTP